MVFDDLLIAFMSLEHKSSSTGIFVAIANNALYGSKGMCVCVCVCVWCVCVCERESGGECDPITDA